jgi:GNAT superfamily N-acetyltransferase
MTEPSATVRVGTLEDLDEVMRLAIAGAEENSFVRPSQARLLNEIYPALVRDHGIVGCVGEHGALEGAVVLRMGAMWYSDDPVLEEKAVFVDPRFRAAKIGRARLLTDFSKQAADSLGIPLVIGVLSNHRTEAKIRLYERQFGKPAGAFFLYGGRTGGQQILPLADAAD